MTLSDRRSPLSISLFLLFGFAGVYVLPYFFPVQPAISESYLMGFNNRVCVIVFVLVLGAFAWWSDGLHLDAPVFRRADDASPRSLSVTPLYVALGLYAAYMIGEWMTVRHRAAYGESIYFLDRLQQLTAGKTPYTQFEFAYGPLLLYVPLWMARILHFSLSDGFYVAWIFEFLLGIVLFWVTCRLLPMSPACRNVVFILSAAHWWGGPLSLGENYTPMRFVLAPLFCLMLLPQLSSGQTGVLSALYGLAAEGMLLLISSEQAVAFFAATLLYVICFRWREREAAMRFLPVFGGGSVGLFWVADRYGLLLAIRGMGGGGYNFPLLPVIQHIPIFALLVVAACALVRSLRTERGGGAVEYMMLLSLALLPAALGRSDPGHLIINSTGGILAGWVVLASKPVWWKRTVNAFVLLVILLPAPLALYHFFHTRHLHAAMPLRAGRASDQLAKVPLAPFSVPVVNNFPSDVGYVDDGYYHGIELVTQPVQVQQKVREIEAGAGRDLIVPGGFSCTWEHNPKFFLHVLPTPYVPPARHTTAIYEPLCQVIHEEYHRSDTLTTPYLGMEIWEPNETKR